ncbi:MAG: hypothetical protein OEV87_09115 [Phycisphaerae bacterium]|nr:hypothetical protein [Phycisphaerae bacterium]
MNMVKLTKRIHILFLSFGVAFLVGCSGEQKKASMDTVADVPAQEAAVKPAEPVKAEPISEPAPSDINEAKQRLVFAQNNMKMAQRGILSYSQAVAICRGVIKDYPNTEYEQQAKELLREVPEDLRSQYNLSDEELGL